MFRGLGLLRLGLVLALGLGCWLLMMRTTAVYLFINTEGRKKICTALAE